MEGTETGEIELQVLNSPQKELNPVVKNLALIWALILALNRTRSMAPHV